MDKTMRAGVFGIVIVAWSALAGEPRNEDAGAPAFGLGASVII